jgi:hypothetical protein
MRASKVLGVWSMVAGLLFWNGALALGVYKPLFGPEAGEMMGAFIAMGVIFGASRPFLIEEREQSVGALWRVGLTWLVLTAVFEFGLGRIAQVVVPRVAPQYGMWDGAFWPLILLASFSAPITWLRRSGLPVERVAK